MADNLLTNIIILVFFVLALAFIVWQFIVMIKDKHLSKDAKAIWAILFFIASLITAIVYFIIRRVR